MPFEKNDPNINRKGRPIPERLEKPTRKQLKDRELLSLLRKLKPHVANAVMRAANIMDNKDAAHQNQLKAATIILDAYRKLNLDLYGDDVDGSEEGEPIQQDNKPLFSLTVVDSTK